jgi:hypothetical protein
MKSVIVALVMAPWSAFAITGNQAIDVMTGSPDADLHLSTYTQGLFDGEVVARMNARYAAEAGAGFIKPFCPPSGASVMQGAAVIRKELLTRPENNHEDLLLISRRALVNA